MEDAQLIDADLRDGVLLRPDSKGNLALPLHYGQYRHGNGKAGRANMSHAKLSNSFVVQTDLTDANLKNVRFVKADLSHSNLTGANLEGADLTEANLTGCILHGAILYNCILSGTNFTDADLAGALFALSENDTNVFASAMMPRVLDALGPEMKSMMADHIAWIGSVGKKGTRGDFSRRDMSTQSLQGLNFAAAKLEFAMLAKCDMRDVGLLMSDASFADMRHADLPVLIFAAERSSARTSAMPSLSACARARPDHRRQDRVLANAVRECPVRQCKTGTQISICPDAALRLLGRRSPGCGLPPCRSAGCPVRRGGHPRRRLYRR